jgi:hypothetical protein
VIDAKHLCVNSRGIRDIDSSTVTGEFGGKFKDPQVKARVSELHSNGNKVQNFVFLLPSNLLAAQTLNGFH